MRPRIGYAPLRLFATAVLGLGLGTGAAAHQDRVIGLAADGSLQGLPAAYAPARLRLTFSAVGDARRLTDLELRLGAAHVRLPTCVLGLIHADGTGRLRLSASWEHDEAILPHYLAARFAEPDDAGLAFTLLFDLHTAQLIEVTADLAHGDGAEPRSLALDLRARCAADELDGVLAPR
ncbi:MAG: hypothetical protein JO224_01120 [Pelomonas sp.]|nr:hypothetical protein [Roseateles sp.]